ncbi:MAG: SLC26A/SulP transporter family protein [Acidobacteria bacterium]|nr:SLC26A/SulP transporter family protein [Acidobacteriota bacterium]
MKREDIFGGAAAMLVAFPSAIAYGLIATAPLGGEYVAHGAVAGILGVIALGLVAPLAGGTPRLISAPCAPAAAMLAAFTTEMSQQGTMPSPGFIFGTLVLAAGIAGIIQIFFGLVKGGRFIKFIPYPVVAGYMSGVGVLIFMSQVPKLFGLAGNVAKEAVLDPGNWRMPALVVGGISIALMVWAPSLIRTVPATIIALLGGMVTYVIFAAVKPELASVIDNPMVVGVIPGTSGRLDASALVQTIGEHWKLLESLQFTDLQTMFLPALLLAVLLSIDTLKTCIVLDTLTRSRHNSNRELMGQGAANLFSSLLGGMPGAGTLGPTLVNLNSGGKTRWSGVMAGVLALLAALLLGRFVAWVALAALAGILAVIAFRLVDWKSVLLLRHRATRFDFAVIAIVTGSAIAFDLIIAAGVGISLAIILFVRDQIRGTVVRRLIHGDHIFSNRQRLPPEQAVLESQGRKTLVAELHGALFFGTTDQLLLQIEPYFTNCRFLILDLRRVHSVDFSAAHMFQQVAERLHEQGGQLIFSGLHSRFNSGQDLADYFARVGLLAEGSGSLGFPELDDALEWVEDELLKEAQCFSGDDARPLDLTEIHLLSGLSPDTLANLAPIVKTRSVAPGEKVFAAGEPGDELFLIRRGSVRILLPVADLATHRLATFGRGDFFGDIAFLDRKLRSADAVADLPTELFVISRADFDRAASAHPRLEGLVYIRLAHALALRLRQTDTELRSLEEA